MHISPRTVGLLQALGHDVVRVHQVMPATSSDEAIVLRALEDRRVVLTQDLARAHRVAAAIDVGLAWVNSWFLRDLRTPFGGAKQSGIGREGGVHSLEFYTELKNVCIKL